MSRSHDEKWRQRGFDPDLELVEGSESFRLTDAIWSLAQTTRSKPQTILLTDSAREHPSLRVVIDLARPLWAEADETAEETPDWYFEGWILAHRKRDLARVRIHVTTLDDPTFGDGSGIITWQLCRPERPPRTDMILAWR